MNLFSAILKVVLKSIVFIGIPISIIYIVSTNYPGLLTDRYLTVLTIAMYLGIPIVLLYFLSYICEGIYRMLFEIGALILLIIYTILIMGYGQTHIKYQELDISIYYPVLMYLVILGILIRFPIPVLRYLSEESEKAQVMNSEDYEDEEI